MSWYNNNSSEFIDGTQQFSGGSGGIVQIVDGNEVNITDLVELRLDHYENEYEDPNAKKSYNLYIQNNNLGGEIRFITKEAEINNDVSNVKLKYNVKIGTDGKIYGYYTYNPTISALTTSRWLDLTDAVVSAQQAGDNALFTATGAGGVAGSAQLTANDALTLAQLNKLEIEAVAVLANGVNVDVGELIKTFDAFKWTRRTVSETFTAVQDSARETLRRSIQERGKLGLQALITAARAEARKRVGEVSVASFNLFSSLVGVYAGAGLTAIGVAGVAYLFDYLIQENRRDTLSQYVRLLDEDEARGTSLGTTAEVLTLSGLQIDQNTNNNFTTAGTYEVDISNDAKLEIVVGTGLTATITKVIGGGEGFSIGTTISIPKSNLGGGIGNLEINIISLISEKQFVENEIVRLKNEIEDTDNRIRRRQNIPTTSSFTNGFNITYTAINEPQLGEITYEPNISLKLDTSQFNYNATGNLQLTNYSQIAQNQSDIATNTANIATNTANIETNTGNIATNTANIATNTTNIATNTGNIATNTTNIATNTANISTNTTDISTLQTAISTINDEVSQNANDITAIQSQIGELGYDDTPILSLLLPKKSDGTTPTITENAVLNNSLLHLGYKGGTTNDNYGDYFILFVMPYFSTTNDITIGNYYLVKDLVANKQIGESGLQIITTVEEYISALQGFIIYYDVVLGNDFYFSIYLKDIQNTFELIYSYNAIEVYFNLTQLKARYYKYVSVEYHYLDSVFTDGLNVRTTSLYGRSNVKEFYNTQSEYYLHSLNFVSSSTDNERTLLQYQSIFTSDSNNQYGFNLYPYKTGNDGDYIMYHTGSRYPVFNNFNFNISRNWTAGSGLMGAIEINIKIFIRVSNSYPADLSNYTTVYTSPNIGLGQQQYQSINNNVIINTGLTTGYNWWLIGYYYTDSSGNLITDNDNKTLMFGKVQTTLIDYGQVLTPFSVIINHNQSFNDNYKHFVFSDQVVNQNKIIYYVDGNLGGEINIPGDRQLINNNYFNIGGIYKYRAFGIGNSLLTSSILNDIPNLAKSNHRLLVNNLSVMEQVYISDKLMVENPIQYRYDDGNFYNTNLEVNGSRRRQIIEQDGIPIDTFTYTDEILIRTPPLQNQFLFYNYLTGLFEGVNTNNFYTKVDIDGKGYLTNDNILDVVRTADISDVVRDSDITDVVRDSDITDVVRTADISDVVRDSDITDVVRNNQITDVVRTADISDVVRDSDITDVVRTADISDVVRDSDISDVVRDSDITDVVRTADISDVVRDSDISDVVRDSDITDVVRTADITDFITLEDIPDVDLSIITVKQNGITKLDYETNKKPQLITGGEPVTHSLNNEDGNELVYPPTRNLYGSSYTLSTSYGAGLYETWESTKASFDNGGFAAFNTSYEYKGIPNQYLNGVYTQNNYIVSDYKGDWVKIKLPVAIKLTRHQIYEVPLFWRRTPSFFRIYGSNDGNNWDLLLDKNYFEWYSSAKTEQNITTNNYYTYFGLVVNKLIGANTNTKAENTLHFAEWYLYGKEKTVTETDLAEHKLLTFKTEYSPSFQLTFDNPTICDILIVSQIYASEYNNIELSGTVTVDSGENRLITSGGNYNALGSRPITFSVDGIIYSDEIFIIRYSKTAPTVITNLYGYLKYDEILDEWITDNTVSGGGGTNDYNQLINKPDLSIYQLISTAFDGNYLTLTNKPTLFDGEFSSLTNLPYSIFQMSINGVFNGSYFTLTDTPDLSVYQLAVNAFSGNYNDLTNKPTISTFDGS